MRSTARLKRKLKKVRAMAKKLKVKLTYKKNGTYKYKSLKRLLNDIKKKKGCKRCIRCKRCKKCKKCVRCKKCKKCNCNKRNRFGGTNPCSYSNPKQFDWTNCWKEMPEPVKTKTLEGMKIALGIWNTNTPEEKKKTWIQRLAKEATENEQPGGKGTEEYDNLYIENYRMIQEQARQAERTENPSFGKKNRFG